jgi:hypothetical protein
LATSRFGLNLMLPFSDLALGVGDVMRHFDDPALDVGDIRRHFDDLAPDVGDVTLGLDDGALNVGDVMLRFHHLSRDLGDVMLRFSDVALHVDDVMRRPSALAVDVDNATLAISHAKAGIEDVATSDSPETRPGELQITEVAPLFDADRNKGDAGNQLVLITSVPFSALDPAFQYAVADTSDRLDRARSPGVVRTNTPSHTVPWRKADMKQIFGLGIALLSSLGCVPAYGAAQLFTCTPYGVGENVDRIYIHCANPQPGPILYYAVSNADHDRAARVLALATGAILAGHSIDIVYDPDDQSGAVYGCSNDCRPIQLVELK